MYQVSMCLNSKANTENKYMRWSGNLVGGLTLDWCEYGNYTEDVSDRNNILKNLLRGRDFIYGKQYKQKYEGRHAWFMWWSSPKNIN